MPPARRRSHREPMMIEQGRVDYRSDPVYLRVPAQHRRNWGRHCGAYGACGEQVYFVQDRWYNNVYAPQYRERHDHGHHGRGHGHGRSDDRDYDSGDRRHDRNDRRDDNDNRQH